MYYVGVDVGGTFTDVFILGNKGISIHKVPSTPNDPSIATVEGMQGVCEKQGIALEDLTLVFHGTTVATNTVLQRSGAKVGMLTTDGFRDLLHIARHKKPLNFSLQQDLPWQTRPLAERWLRQPIEERVIAPEGEIETPVNLKQVEEAAEFFNEAGVEAVAVCFLHSYLNSENEERVAEVLAEKMPEAYVSLRHSVCPEYREYESFNTVVLNAYLGPVTGRYLGLLNSRLASAGREGDVLYMTSTGGVENDASVAAKPVSMILSGPVGGVVGGMASARASGFENIITLDVGGTSADIALVAEGEFRHKHWLDNSIGDLHLRLSMVDVSTIGAGGGSIAAVDHGGMLQVGPRSAGASPGPACYGRGGEEPTVTDAQVVLGRLAESSFLGGRMAVVPPLSTEAVEQRIAQSLGRSTIESAAGILQVATAHMVDAIELASVRRGHDPRDFALVAFGGGGALFACDVARELAIEKILVPRYPGVAAAMGLVASDVIHDVKRSLVRDLADVDATALEDLYGGLEKDVLARLKQDGFADRSRRIERWAECRYVGQGYELEIEVPLGEIDQAWADKVTQRFHERHEREYGNAFLERGLTLVNVIVRGIGEIEALEMPQLERATGPAQRIGTRSVWFEESGDFAETSIFARDSLLAGHEIEGPAIVEQEDSTVVVPPGAVLRVDGPGNVIITLGAGRGQSREHETSEVGK